MSRKHVSVAIVLVMTMVLLPSMFANVDAHPNAGPAVVPYAGSGFSPVAVISGSGNDQVSFTVRKPVLVPHAALEPGKYTVKFMDQDMGTVAIDSASGNRVGVFSVMPAERNQAARNVEVRVAHLENGKSRIVSWFLPGTTQGWEFIYPRAGHAVTVSQAKTGAVAGE